MQFKTPGHKNIQESVIHSQGKRQSKGNNNKGNPEVAQMLEIYTYLKWMKGQEFLVEK